MNPEDRPTLPTIEAVLLSEGWARCHDPYNQNEFYRGVEQLSVFTDHNGFVYVFWRQTIIVPKIDHHPELHCESKPFFWNCERPGTIIFSFSEQGPRPADKKHRWQFPKPFKPHQWKEFIRSLVPPENQKPTYKNRFQK